MKRVYIVLPIMLLIGLAVIAGIVYLFILIVKALRKYVNSSQVRVEKKASSKTLGEAIKKHRTELKMTQDFVAEYLGVSRQAVSKWESGTSDPSTSNLIALAKLFGVAPEELLNEVKSS